MVGGENIKADVEICIGLVGALTRIPTRDINAFTSVSRYNSNDFFEKVQSDMWMLIDDGAILSELKQS